MQGCRQTRASLPQPRVANPSFPTTTTPPLSVAPSVTPLRRLCAPSHAAPFRCRNPQCQVAVAVARSPTSHRGQPFAPSPSVTAPICRRLPRRPRSSPASALLRRRRGECWSTPAAQPSTGLPDDPAGACTLALQVQGVIKWMTCSRLIED